MLKFDDSGFGQPVLLIHGFPLCRKMWRPQVVALNARGYRVVCPDLPGFGDSEPLDEPVSMTDYANSVISLLDHLEIQTAVVGGMSMGGYVLLNLLERFPQRLSAAMFLMTRAGADDSATKQKRTALANAALAGDNAVVANTFSQVLFAPQTVTEKMDLMVEVRQWMTSTDPRAITGALLAMRDRSDYVNRLPKFDLPVLVVGAQLDLAIPVEHARLLADQLPEATLAVIPSAGHMANLEQPALFNQVLLDFLGNLS